MLGRDWPRQRTDLNRIADTFSTHAPLAARGPNVCASRVHAVFHDAVFRVGLAVDPVLPLEGAHCGELRLL